VSKSYLETIKAKDGEIFHLSYHQKRLKNTLENSEIVLEDIIKPPKFGLYRCRVVYNAQSYKVSYHPYTKRSIQKLKLVYDDSIEYNKKYFNREQIDKLFIKKEYCDDILIVKNGYVTDTSIANIAFRFEDKWFTPKQVLLAGTTRARLLKEKKIFEKDIRVDDLGNFSQIALMNAMIDFDIIQQENFREIIC
jgi:4-amino-4-deoxychorismate lyase